MLPHRVLMSCPMAPFFFCLVVLLLFCMGWEHVAGGSRSRICSNLQSNLARTSSKIWQGKSLEVRPNSTSNSHATPRKKFVEVELEKNSTSNRHLEPPAIFYSVFPTRFNGTYRPPQKFMGLPSRVKCRPADPSEGPPYLTLLGRPINFCGGL